MRNYRIIKDETITGNKNFAVALSIFIVCSQLYDVGEMRIFMIHPIESKEKRDAEEKPCVLR